MKNKQIFMISGLPRAGSTILSNILAQNTKIHSSPTSGLLDTLFSIRNNWETLIEHRASPYPQKLQNVLKSVFYAYYEEVDKPIIMDKSRGWLAYIEMMENVIGNNLKILVPIRPLTDILASFEVLYRNTSKVKRPPGEAENYFQFQTTKGRCDFWLKADQPIGLALNRLDDVVRRGLKDRLHFVEFEKLTNNPKQKLQEIYNFLGEKYYEHDFDNVEQVTKENDDIHGFIDLHKIRNKVEPVPSKAKEILGEDLVKFYNKK